MDEDPPNNGYDDLFDQKLNCNTDLVVESASQTQVYEVEDDELVDSDYEVSEDDLAFEEDFQLYMTTVGSSNQGPILEELLDDPGSDDYDTDELRSLDSSSESEIEDGQNKPHTKKKQAPKFHQFRLQTDLRTSYFTLGMKFSNANHEFRLACKEAFINDGRQCRFSINIWYKVKVVCLKYPTCKYHVYASMEGKPDKSKPTLQVKTLCVTHTCGRDDKNRHVSSTWLAGRFAHEFRLNPAMKNMSFKDIVRDKYMYEITDAQAYRAKRLATEKLEGNQQDQYAKLRDYLHQIRLSNPGTTVKLHAPLDILDKIVGCARFNGVCNCFN